MSGSLILALFGFIGIVGLWLGHDQGVPNPRGLGEWQSVPPRVRPFLRRGPGPVLIGAVFVQIALLGWIVLFAIDVFAPALLAMTYFFMVITWILAAASWVYVWGLSRRQ